MDTKTKQLGNLHGRVLIFGGVYSNLQALEKLRAIAQQEGIPASNCICTGDIVGYCAQPMETVEFFRDWNPHSIAGNVEIQLSEGKEDCGCDFIKGSRCEGFSQQWYPYAKSRLSKDAVNWMKSLPEHIRFIYGDLKCTVVHGSFEKVSEFIFKSTPWSQKQKTFDETGSDLVIAGHCGIPFQDSKGGRIWINPGVIGMPANNGNPAVWYAILDQNTPKLITHHSFLYDYKLASELMLLNSLPQEYARTLNTGIWDNTEILPEKERLSRALDLSV